MTASEEASGPDLVSLRLDEDLVAAVVRGADGDVVLRLRSVGAGRAGRRVEGYLSTRGETSPWVTMLAAGTVVFGELPDGSDRVEIRGADLLKELEVADGVYLAHLDHRPADAAEVMPCSSIAMGASFRGQTHTC